MKRFLLVTAVVSALVSVSAVAADVGVSVSIGQPGFYGRIDIGDYPYPQPLVIYRQPRVIERVYIEREPIYLRVPPGHARNWGRYCHRYNACGERVYFVQDSWYRQEFAPRYQERQRNRGNDYHEYHEYHDDDRGNYGDDRGNYGDNRGGHGDNRKNNNHHNRGHKH